MTNRILANIIYSLNHNWYKNLNGMWATSLKKIKKVNILLLGPCDISNFMV